MFFCVLLLIFIKKHKLEIRTPNKIQGFCNFSLCFLLKIIRQTPKTIGFYRFSLFFYYLKTGLTVKTPGFCNFSLCFLCFCVFCVFCLFPKPLRLPSRCLPFSTLLRERKRPRLERKASRISTRDNSLSLTHTQTLLRSRGGNRWSVW